MSVDTTVAILVTKSQTGNKEYRVRCIQAAENLEYKERDNLFYNYVRSNFAKCPVVYTEDEALDLAEKEEEEHVRLMGFNSEYGTGFFRFNETFEDLINSH